LGELIVAAKGRPGTVAVAHTGNGTVGHLADEVFCPAGRIKVLIVLYNYKGAAPPTFCVGRSMCCSAIRLPSCHWRVPDCWVRSR
jgi:tripartite-type tricarboxylate transporter receptor subunit TctC